MSLARFSGVFGLSALLMLMPRPAVAIMVSGGDATNDVGDYRIHTFTQVGTTAFTVAVGGSFEVLVVGGGGGGGETIGGGGGGGGLIYTNAYALTSGVFTVTVGDGGAGGWGGDYPAGVKGGNSVFATLVAIGGGAGGGYNGAASGTGGSAGGNGAAGGARAPYTVGQGTDGGNGDGGNAGGGGGGASQAGAAGASGTGGKGGEGTSCSIASGASVYYAGGGGGGTRTGNGAGGAGGAGGGGAGGTGGNPGVAGTANTGGGGGGGGFSSDMPGGNGGSGIVIVRYLNQTNLAAKALAANPIGKTTATLNGILSGDGSDANTTVAFCWGVADGGTSGGTSAWAHVEALGAGWGKDQLFSASLSGLLSGTAYLYRVYATNSTGLSWSDAVSFRTIFLPSVTNLGASSVGGFSATLRGAVLETGGEAPLVSLYYWPQNGATSVVAAGAQSGAFELFVSGLQEGVPYAFKWGASNAAGVVETEAQGFTTASRSLTWTGAINADWFEEGNWSPAGVPQPGDAATIPSASVSPVLARSCATLAALTVTDGTLTCTNWGTVVRAADVTIQNTGKITLPPAFSDTAMSNRVYIVCSNLTVEAGGAIDASGKGYVNAGPGKGYGSDLVGGSGHGGRGGAALGHFGVPNVAGGSAYGSESEPNEPGSSPPICYTGSTSGKGGGVVRIEAPGGTVTLNGVITADGGSPVESHAGGGAGGSVYIACGRFQGSAAGSISARGGNAYGWDWSGGSGGGGRIAVISDTCNLPSVQLSAAQGYDYFAFGDNEYASEMGTIYLTTTNLLTPVISGISGRLIMPGVTAWATPSLTVSNGAVGFGDGLQLDVAGDLTVTGAGAQLAMGANGALTCGGRLAVVGGKVLTGSNTAVACGSGTLDNGQLILVKGDLACSTDLALTNGSLLYAYSGATNGLAVDGSRVTIAGDLNVAPSCWVCPVSEPFNGGSPVFRAGTMTLAANGGFNANGRGYDVGQGPGHPGGNDNATGGSHGGKGGLGMNYYAAGPTNGSADVPLTTGSGSGYSYGDYRNSGKGGGQVRLFVDGLLTLNGSLYAGGGDGKEGHSGGGAGGSVFVLARRLQSGVGSLLAANGGNGGYNGGSGGGGRIALWVGVGEDQIDGAFNPVRGVLSEPYDKFQGTVTVDGGSGYLNGPPNGSEPGTVRMLHFFHQGTVIIVQ